MTPIDDLLREVAMLREELERNKRRDYILSEADLGFNMGLAVAQDCLAAYARQAALLAPPAPDVHALLTRLAKDIGAVAALVRERGYGTERDKPAMLARLDGWQQTVQAALAHAPATPARERFAEALTDEVLRRVRNVVAPSSLPIDEDDATAMRRVLVDALAHAHGAASAKEIR